MFCNSGNCHQINSDVISIRNAVIDDIVIDRRNSIVTVSYFVIENRVQVVRTLSMIVSDNTRVKNQNGRVIPARDLRVGMFVNALVSSAMTRSIPPQTRAFQITVVRGAQPPVPPPVPVTTGRIVSVDLRNNMFTIGVPWDINRQMRFVVNRDTVILTRNGRRVGLQHLIPGMTVRVEYSDFQTASIPPQAVAYVVQILS